MPKITQLIIRSLTIITLLVINGSLTATPNTRPNIVFILADDLGFGDIKSFGKERCQIETPGFDQLAREGVRFTDAHANASVCVPTRKAIMTGKYAWRFGRSAPSGPWGFIGSQFPKGQHTLGHMLRKAGYKTGYVGKWHLGTKMQTTDGKVQGPKNVDYKKPLLDGPKQHGFDYSFILPGSLDMYPYVYARNNEWLGKVNSQKGWSAFNRVGPAADDFEDHEVLNTFSTEVEGFIKRNAKNAQNGKPFFIYMALTAPHTPTSPSDKFKGKSKIGVYGDFVMETDDCVNRVLNSLKANGLDRNTLVIATSDHGPASYAGRELKATFNQLKELEKEGHYSSGPYRGYKFSIYEGAFRVPFVARWPGVVPKGLECKELIALQDLMATLADITKVKFENHQAPDSISFYSLLKNPQGPATRDFMILDGVQGRALRIGDWKLALCPGSGSSGRWGNVPKSDTAWREALGSYGKRIDSRSELHQAPFVQLFNLEEDPSESKNLAQQHPERIQAWIKRAQKLIERGRSTPGQPLKNGFKTIPLFKGVPRMVFK